MDELRPGRRTSPTRSRACSATSCICPQVARGRRATPATRPQEELLLLTTHGILHLLGYDHAEPEEEEEMFGLQRELLLTFLATRGRPSA